MDGAHPIRVIQDGDHQVVHLPRDVMVAPGSVARREGDKVILEPRARSEGLIDLLEAWAAEPPLTEDERLPPVLRGMPRPFDL